MVGVAISLVILAALVALFVNTSRSSREFARANSMIESGRLAVQVLENDVAHAGFWGTYVPHFDDQTAAAPPDDVPTAVPDPCLAYNPANWTDDYVNDLIGMPVQVYDDATVCPGIITDRQANTDVLMCAMRSPVWPAGPRRTAMR
jgi:type IV pilus assembly protein PilW